MSFSNISDMLLELNRDITDQKSGLALSNTSELEIKNLLKQIDTMINHKKLKWERQKQELDNRVKLKEQECSITKAALDQKTHEVEQMKTILESMDTRAKDIMKKYENEIDVLNGQLNKLKNEYMKIQKKYKKYKENRRPGSGDADGGGGSLAGSRLNSPSFSSSVSECLGEIQNSMNQTPSRQKRKSNIHIDIDIVTQLRSQINEHKLKELELINERDKLNQQIEQLKTSNQELMRKTNDLAIQNSNNLTYGEKLIYENEIRKRDDYIKNLETTIKNVPERTNNSSNDANELKSCKEELKKFKKQENMIRHELNKLKLDYNDAIKRLANLENENKKIKAKQSLSDEKSKATTEILSLKRKLTAEKERHIMEIEQLKSEIYSFSNQLADKNVQIHELNEKLTQYIKEIKEKDENFEKTNQELAMSIAHCEALRLENQFLQQSVDERKNDEHNLAEMQKRYHELIDLSEKENKRLKNEVIQMTQLIEQLRTKQPAKDTLSHENSELNYRRIKLLKDDFEKQMDSIKEQHEISLKRLKSEIDKLNNEKHALVAELDAAKRSSKNLNVQRSNVSGISSLSNGTLITNSEHTVTNDDVFKRYNSDDLLSQKSQARGSVDNSSMIGRARHNLIDSPTQQIRLSLGSQFRMDDQKRKKELENLLDSHIEALKKSTYNRNDLETDFIKA